MEVRKLAERSQLAAKDIRELAKQSVSKAEEAGKVIQQMVPDIREASTLVKDITSACNEQTHGTSQIRAAVQSLDQVTQQNSAVSEESAAASDELTAQARSLQEMVSKFIVQQNHSSNYHASTPKSSHSLIPYSSQRNYQENDDFSDF